MRHGLLAAVSAVASAAPLWAQSSDRVDRVSAQTFETTAQQLETALQGGGFMIVARADHQNMLRMVGANVKGSRTIEFGKPDMLKSHLQAHPEIGLERYLAHRGTVLTLLREVRRHPFPRHIPERRHATR